MGWLTDVTTWLKEAFTDVFEAVTSFLIDYQLMLVKTGADVVLWILGHLPFPEFMTDLTIGGLLGQSGPDILFFVDRLRLGEGFVLIGAACAFKIVRKCATLFQW